MKYIITGGAGFIGSHLTERLLAMGHSVTVIDNLLTGKLENLSKIDQMRGYCFIRGDAGEESTWNGICQDGDIVLHFAATVGVNKVCENSLQTLLNNARQTELILEQALKYRNKVFLASTSEVYGNSSGFASSEDDSVNVNLANLGRSAYVVGKLYSEQISLNYHRSFGLPVIVGRLFNVIGPRQVGDYGMVVPTFINQARNSRPITVFGTGEQQRCFGHVSDIIDAILLLLDNDECNGKIFNIGANELTSINQLAEMVRSLSGSTSPIIHKPFPIERNADSDSEFRLPDLTRILKYTGWSPSRSWKDCIGQLLEINETTPSYEYV